MSPRRRAERTFSTCPTASRRGPRRPSAWALDFTLGLFGGESGRRPGVIERLQIGPLLQRRIGRLSKGERKRVLLAIALLTPQPILMADEPFDGLDLRQSREVGAALRDHAAAGRTLFLSIHQIGDAVRVCDRFVLISGGAYLRRRHVRRARGGGPRARRHGAGIRRGRACAHLARAFGWLVRKEWRDLMASRSWWVMLVLMGPLVGVSFISAVRTYGELSGAGGTGAGVGEAFAPLIGIWAPTFSACELAAAFLLPFVAIRLVSGDRQSGALKLELQHPMPALARMAAKALVLLAAWLLASLPPLIAIVFWRLYGGTMYWPELTAVFAGHLLNAGLSVALACAAASLTEHPSTAAILTLSVTVGTWILSFVAAVHGGLWDRLAGYTPTAMVGAFPARTRRPRRGA